MTKNKVFSILATALIACGVYLMISKNDSERIKIHAQRNELALLNNCHATITEYLLSPSKVTQAKALSTVDQCKSESNNSILEFVLSETRIAVLNENIDKVTDLEKEIVIETAKQDEEINKSYDDLNALWEKFQMVALLIFLLILAILFYSISVNRKSNFFKSRREKEFSQNPKSVICIVNHKGKIIDVNKNLIETFNLMRKTVLARTFLFFIHPEDKRDVEKEFQTIIKQQDSPNNFSCRLLIYGIEFIYNWAVEYDRKEDLYYCVGTDITEAVKSQKAKTTSLKHLYINMQNSTRTIHNTLNEINLDDIPKKENTMQVLKENSTELNRLISTAIDVSLVDSESLILNDQPFALKDLIDSIRSSFTNLSELNRTKIIVDYEEKIPSLIIGDKDRIELILTHLFSNSIKNTIDGTIFLRTRLLQKSEEAVTIQFEIIDTGLGVSNTDMANLFERGGQYKNESPETGLGLFLVNNLVGKMGGIIRLKKENTKGTKIQFHLRLKLPAMADVNADGTDPNVDPDKITDTDIEDSTNDKILLVENSQNEKSATDLLTKLNLKFEVVNSHVSSLERLSVSRFKLVILNLQDNLDTIRGIRNGLNLSIPIINLISDNRTKTEVNELFNENDTSLLTPVSSSEISKAVNRLRDFQ